MTVIQRFYGWVCQDEWRWLACFMLAQVVSVVSFVVFAHWIADYARLNWY